MNSAPSYAPRLLPLRLPRVCVAVTGSDPNEMVEKAELLVRDNPFLEFRLDYLSKPGLALPRIKRLLESYPGTVVIDRKSTRLNSSHRCISYAVFCLKK